MQQGRQEGKVELYYTELGLEPYEIAAKLKISEPEVNDILEKLNLLPHERFTH